MAKVEVVARLIDGDSLECKVTAPIDLALVLTGKPTDVAPETSGPSALVRNAALVDNAWAHAKFRHLSMTLPTKEEQKDAGKRSDAHRRVARWIAGLAVETLNDRKEAWCSACFVRTDQVKTKRQLRRLTAYLCSTCGSPTLPCVGPRCKNFAVLTSGATQGPRYCAEHRHEIPGFEKAAQRMKSLGDFEEFLQFEKTNLSRMTKIAGVGLVGLALGAPAALIAAPAIGGAFGTLLGGYTGAAATSHGLALLGGGTLASGGFGMAGGTLVVTAAGGALGGTLGASVTNAYVREDKSFGIERLCDGPGAPVVVCSGFLSQGGAGWDEWEQIITNRFPDSPVYRVHWGSKELKHLGALGGAGSLKTAAGVAVKKGAARATKSGAVKIGPLGPILVLADIAKNPWHIAKDRANKTGVILADLIARTDIESYVLVGHSLGGRVAVIAAQALSTKSHSPRLESVHLLGAAIGARSDWHNLTSAVEDAVYNYHSTKDKVLRWLYRVTQAGQCPGGMIGFKPSSKKLVNIDVSALVTGHSGYFESVTLEGSTDGE